MNDFIIIKPAKTKRKTLIEYLYMLLNGLRIVVRIENIKYTSIYIELVGMHAPNMCGNN